MNNNLINKNKFKYFHSIMETAPIKHTNDNKENLLNKKIKRDSHSDKAETGNDSKKEIKNKQRFSNQSKSNRNEKTRSKGPAQGITKFTQIESFYNKARQLYEANVRIRDSYIIYNNGKN